jgi:hypothetical protein
MGESIPRVEVPTAAVEEISMYAKTSVRSSSLEGQERPWMRSFFKVAKKLSATALSK